MFIFKVVLLVLVVLGAGNYLVYWQTGTLAFDYRKLSFANIVEEVRNFSLQLPDISLDTQKGMTNKSDDSENARGSKTKDKIYKWVDENGVTQLSSTPPPVGQEAQLLLIDPDTNVIQNRAVNLAAGSSSAFDQRGKTNITTGSGSQSKGQNYSPTEVKQLMDDARNVQNLLDERFENQRKIIEQQK
ncbi:DUF4124 domain-containing protein [Motiliproteus sp. MSK22-1]|uniref:DUF4124 domain-containing protein n=1 Tax=Motiliproteus sp. MSK22-1 TaxID=1897630 RepID=UPI0013010167|nr:DUF4124 domain-containing protein [Motiliproteus sp. MSK22-1]